MSSKRTGTPTNNTRVPSTYPHTVYMSFTHHINKQLRRSKVHTFCTRERLTKYCHPKTHTSIACRVSNPSHDSCIARSSEGDLCGPQPWTSSIWLICFQGLSDAQGFRKDLLLLIIPIEEGGQVRSGLEEIAYTECLAALCASRSQWCI
jgi:hypothetical protein